MFSKKKSYSVTKSHLKNSSVIKDDGTIDADGNLNDEGTNLITGGKKLKIFLCLIYLFIHCVSTQLTSVIVKKVTYVSVCQHSLTRYAGMFALTLPIAVYYNRQLLGKKEHRLVIIVRGLLAANGLYFQIIAMSYLDLVEASIILSTCPFVTAIFARFILKEPFGLVQTSTMIITILGVLLSLRLPELLSSKSMTFDSSYAIGLITAVISVFCLALNTVALRKVKDVHYSVLMLYMSFVGMIENAVLSVGFFPLVFVDCGWHQILFILVGILTFSSDFFFTMSVKLESAGIVAVERSSFDIIVTAVLQILFFSKNPDIYVISGSCLVILSLVIIGVKNWVLTLPETSKRRQRLKWILS